ncbi:MAG: tetratricopeptide repeat protein [PVC group bacterium]
MKRSYRQLLALVGIILLGGLLRLIYLREMMAGPEFFHPAVDAAYHDCWARGLAGGDWTLPAGYRDPGIRTRPFFRPPGYPYLLAALYLLPGDNSLVPRLAQMALGLLGIPVAFIFARRWYGARAALIFAGLTAVYWGFIYFEGELLDASVGVFLTLLLLTLSSSWVERVGPGPGFLTGLTLGVFALFRPNVLLFGPVLLVWAFRLRCRTPPAGRLSLHLAGFFLGVLLAVAPVTLRNYLVGGDVVLISAQGGMSLLIGNNEEASGTNHHLPGYGVIDSPFDYPAAVRSLEKELGLDAGELPYSAASRLYTRRALSYIFSHPGRFFTLTVRKVLLFWGPAEVTNNREISEVRARSPVLRAIPFGFSFCFASALAGALLFFSGTGGRGTDIQSRRVSLLTALFIGTYFLSVLPVAAAARYRLPVIPGLLLFASLGAGALLDLRRLRRYGRVVLWTLIWGALLFLVSRNLSGYQYSPAKWHYDRAVAFEGAGRPEAAEAEYRRALEVKPDDYRSRMNLGAILLRQDDAADAVAEFRRAVALRPDRAEAHNNLGSALSRAGRLAEAAAVLEKAIMIDPECVRAYSNLGTVLQARGDGEAAVNAFRRALPLQPETGEFYYNFGLVLAKQGRIEEAIEQYRTAVRIDPGSSDTQNNLGIALAARGDTEAAVAHLREAVRLNPGLEVAHVNLANILASRQRYPEAVAHYQRALQINPDSADARYNLGYTLELSGAKEDAVRQYRDALRADREHVQAHYRLARLLLENNRVLEAEEHLRAALSVDPAFAPARELLPSGTVLQ